MPIVRRKDNSPNIVRGGKAHRIGNNLWRLSGNTHEQGGIDIGENARTGIEAEHGEVMETTRGKRRIFSSMPIVQGMSPANLVQAGINPDIVFAEQEKFKALNRINDDGSTYKTGGAVSTKTKKENKTVDISRIRPIEKIGLSSDVDKVLRVKMPYGIGHNATQFSPTGGKPAGTAGVVRGTFANNKTNDIIGLGTNILGSVLSYKTGKSALKEYKAPEAPILAQPNRLKTHVNISPQLGEIKENARRGMDDIDANVSSSAHGLASKQRQRNYMYALSSNLYGNKENQETQLINQDRLNRQGVHLNNVSQINDYKARTAAFNNELVDRRLGNYNGLISGVNASIQDYITRREEARQFDNNLAYLRGTSPHVDDRIFADNGAKYKSLKRIRTHGNK